MNNLTTFIVTLKNITSLKCTIHQNVHYVALRKQTTQTPEMERLFFFLLMLITIQLIACKKLTSILFHLVIPLSSCKLGYMQTSAGLQESLLPDREASHM